MQELRAHVRRAPQRGGVGDRELHVIRDLRASHAQLFNDLLGGDGGDVGLRLLDDLLHERSVEPERPRATGSGPSNPEAADLGCIWGKPAGGAALNSNARAGHYTSN